MNDEPPCIYIFRHGQTEWSKLGKHTGRTDIPLNSQGEEEALLLKEKFQNKKFEAVFCSPLQRAKKTCEIMGFLEQAEIDDDLSEWDYGDYEGLTSSQIREKIPHWSVFTHSCPRGETLKEMSERADRIIKRISNYCGDIAIFSSGHISRILAMRWINISAEFGKNFILSTGTYSILSYERGFPAIKVWNASL